MSTEMDRETAIKLLKKSFVMFGFTYFSVAITLQTWTSLTPAMLAAGLYLFTEASRILKVNYDNEALRNKKKKTKTFIFLI